MFLFDHFIADLIAIPDFSLGAMENWGLITYRNQYLLYDEHLSTERDKMEVAIVIAHELAHQVLIVEASCIRCGLHFVPWFRAALDQAFHLRIALEFDADPP